MRPLDNGRTASGIHDNTSAVVLVSETYVKQQNNTPGTYRFMGNRGVDPTIIGIGPVSSIKLALKNVVLTLNDSDNRVK